MTKIVLTEEENGGFVQARITNQSRSDQCVHVRMESTPPGWMALPLGEPVRVLNAGDEMEVSIQIERMVVLESSEDPLPFSLRISLPGTSVEHVTSTFYISAKAPRRSKSRRTTG